MSIEKLLQTRGWALFDLQQLEFTEDERFAVSNWESVFGTAFDLSLSEKEEAGVYRVEQGVSVGYRMDSEREFFESRILSTSHSEPEFRQISDYSRTVISLYSVFCKIGRHCIEEVSRSVGLDPQCFLDLTDLECAGVLPCSAPPKKKGDITSSEELIPTLSSSLLRICKYKSLSPEESAQKPPDKEIDTSEESALPAATSEKSVWFGAHTDSSFLTISLCSTTPGLDIVDQASNTWVCPEKSQCLASSESNFKIMPESTADTVFQSVNDAAEASTALPSARYAIVFVGEFLQVLTKNRYNAAVHRVRNFRAEATFSPENDAFSTRISCPFIIRGRNNAIIDLHNTEKYAHAGGEEALGEDKVPNLDGTTVGLMHKLLDLKRQRCFRENGSAEGSNWVLSAYPVPPLPEER